MATVDPAPETTDLLHKLSIDSQTKTLEAPEITRKKQDSMNSAEVANVPISSCGLSAPTLLPDVMDPNICYFPNGHASYYYGGYDGTIGDWEYARFLNEDGGIYGDNRSLMYHHGCGYSPYAAYPPAGSPVPSMGHDLYGHQHYQYAASYYPPPATPNGTYVPRIPKGDVSASTALDHVPVEADKGNPNMNETANEGMNGSTKTLPPNSSAQNEFCASNGSDGRVSPGSPFNFPASCFWDPRFGLSGVHSPIPWFEVSDVQPRSSSSTNTSVVTNVSSGRNQNYHPAPNFMGLHPSRGICGSGTATPYVDCIHPNNGTYGEYGNGVRTRANFSSSSFDSRRSVNCWLAVDKKLKPRSQGYGNENTEWLNELKRGPRADLFNSQRGFFPDKTITAKGQNLTCNDSKEESTVVLDGSQYNQSEFPISYSEAKFFIIKSYSEDDIHKSIKYNVWSSTPNGNKKLDAAYSESQGKPGGCPVFLFFSVNASGQFVGLAEMVGSVDFTTNVDHWQQDKWTGCFPVKWHIIKDVPNSLLKHITLDNNENKPVTNSRDTQEVKLDKGLEMLQIFKDHTSKTCILDDFGFYDDRHKIMLEKKNKQQQFHNLLWTGKPSAATIGDKDTVRCNGEMRLALPPKTDEIGSQSLEDRKQSENGLISEAGGDAPIEKPGVANEVADIC